MLAFKFTRKEQQYRENTNQHPKAQTTYQQQLMSSDIRCLTFAWEQTFERRCFRRHFIGHNSVVCRVDRPPSVIVII